jgi:16S rRNA U516 pseudouridylate synthase RsuA-like enzyme
MCQAVGLDVRTLHRNRVGAIKLGQLPRGCWRFLSTNELF